MAFASGLWNGGVGTLRKDRKNGQTLSNGDIFGKSVSYDNLKG